MDNQEEDVRLTLRISRAMYERIVRLARGDGRRPAAKVNPTIEFLIERALSEIESEKESGNWEPALMAA